MKETKKKMEVFKKNGVIKKKEGVSSHVVNFVYGVLFYKFGSRRPRLLFLQRGTAVYFAF